MEDITIQEQEQIKGKLVTPIGNFNCQTYPIDKDFNYFITDEELDKLSKHELKWSSEEYETEQPIYEEIEDKNGLIEKVEVGKEKVIKSRPILIENNPTEENEIVNNKKRIVELKRLLQETDYKAIKYAEGLISEDEYLPIKQQRQQWRDEINRLQATLPTT